MRHWFADETEFANRGKLEAPTILQKTAISRLMR
jgi:hypothetical protein